MADLSYLGTALAKGLTKRLEGTMQGQERADKENRDDWAEQLRQRVAEAQIGRDKAAADYDIFRAKQPPEPKEWRPGSMDEAVDYFNRTHPKDPPKTLEQIRAEAQARAEGAGKGGAPFRREPEPKEKPKDRRFEEYVEQQQRFYQTPRFDRDENPLPNFGVSADSARTLATKDAIGMGYPVPKEWLERAAQNPAYAEYLKGVGIDPTTGAPYVEASDDAQPPPKGTGIGGMRRVPFPEKKRQDLNVLGQPLPTHKRP